MSIQIKDVNLAPTESTMVDLVEGVGDISEITEAIEGLLYRIEGLEALSIALESFDTHTPATAALTQITTDLIRQGTDLTEDEVVPGLESMGSTQVSLEGVWETVRKAAKKVAEFITSLWTRFMAWFDSFFDQSSRLKRQLTALKETVKPLNDAPAQDTVTIMPGVAKFLAIGSTPVSDKSIRASINALNESMFYTNAVVKGTISGWDASEESFKSVIGASEYVSVLVDANLDKSDTIKHVDNIMHNLAIPYNIMVGFNTEYPKGLSLPGGKVVTMSVTDVKTDDVSYAQKIRGGDSKAKINMLRLYSTANAEITTDPLAKDYASSFSLPSLSKKDTLSIIESLDNLLDQVIKFRKDYERRLKSTRQSMVKIYLTLDNIKAMHTNVRQAENAFNHPENNRGSMELVRILATQTLVTYSTNLTKFPAKHMTIIMRSILAMLGYLKKCAKALGATVDASDSNEVPTLALPHHA